MARWRPGGDLVELGGDSVETQWRPYEDPMETQWRPGGDPVETWWRAGGDGGLGGDLVERTEIGASASQMSFPMSRKYQYSISKISNTQ